MDLTFERCRKLAATNPDHTFCDAHLPRLRRIFDSWLPGLAWERIATSEYGYTYIYLFEQAEADIAGLMLEDPSQAWALASLAYIMLRLKAEEVLGVAGCLPLPALRGELADALQGKGLLINGRLLHKFSLLTFSDAGLNCAICSLAPECPQIK